ncbi:hypothetical protein [Crossiella cryophila]|uniref:Tetratricopeptide repeat protein n=1 Tax=Crossiella cryophila TaxID=43355 RepID=A0A7W7CLW7_9PSEU|nr:hypothetical protein [Crossiella cryophila]MBB4682231.1 hypothetical protein [Crossiella cryophila]
MGSLTRPIRPGRMFIASAAIAVVALERALDPAVVGMLGAVIGMLAELMALQLGLLLGALALRVRVHDVVLGLGARVYELRTPRRTVSLRVLPILLGVSVGPGAAPAQSRMWLAGAVSAVCGAGAAAATFAVVDAPFGRGLAVGALAAGVYCLLPRRDAGTTSTGWLLFQLPRLPKHRVAEWQSAPLVNEAIDAVNGGDLETAEALTAELSREHPGRRTTTATRIALLEARGRYAEALALTIGLVSDPTQEPRDLAFALASLAALTANAVEVGQLDAATGLPTARQAVDDAEQLGYPGFKLTGTKALLELLAGNADRAAMLARSGARHSGATLSRADDLATLARALMATGDNRAARLALDEAETLAPWWPRVAGTRARLSVT